MPYTLLHYPLAYLMHRLNGGLSFPGLIVGSMLPDFEIPVIVVFYPNTYFLNRLVLHSLLGAVTVGALLSVLFTVLVYPAILRGVFRAKREAVKAQTSLSVNLVVSCMLGGVSHVLLDLFTHQYNPVFWPLQATTFSPVASVQSALIVNVLFAFLCLAPLIMHRRNIVQELLIK